MKELLMAELRARNLDEVATVRLETGGLFVVAYAGHYYGPFDSANDAAAWAAKGTMAGPWTIVRLRRPMTDEELMDVKKRFEAAART
jgi:hypothetical protein